MRLLILLLFAMTSAKAQIRVSDNHRFLANADGTPFFWLGDTDWEMFHRLSREEVDEFISIRAGQGFNVLQSVALAEFEGIRKPNRYGDWPLNNEDPTQLLVTPGNNPASAYEYDYWDHVEYVIRAAAAKGIYIGLLPTWGDKVAHMWGDGPIIFNEKSASVYGKLIAERFAGHKNIIWIIGGDRPGTYQSKRNAEGVEKSYDDRAVWRAMALGIEAVAGSDAFITYHPAGGKFSTSQFIHEEPWLDMNAFQSGHGSREADAWNLVARDLSLKPQKPTLDMEPCYEDHPVNPWDGKWTRQRGYFTAYDVRARIYRGVFAGGSGVTYGHHHIWQFMDTTLNPPVNVGDTLIPWRKAARAEAAEEMRFLRQLMLSRPYFTRSQDQSLIKSAAGTDYKDLVIATRDESGKYAMIYLPENKPVKIELGRITGKSRKAWWFDPRSGISTSIKSVKAGGVQTFTPPPEGRDWVLVIDDASMGFPAPGGK